MKMRQEWGCMVITHESQGEPSVKSEDFFSQIGTLESKLGSVIDTSNL